MSEAVSGDAVAHPPHYTSHPSGVECIEITEHMDFLLGNALKYIWRAGLKSDDPIQDLEKAVWYIQRKIDLIKRQERHFSKVAESIEAKIKEIYGYPGSG